MKVTKKQAATLKQAISYWQQEGLISEPQAASLNTSYDIVGFNWKLLAVYSFWIAITCLVISVGVLLADDYLLMLLAKLIDTPASVLAVISAAIAAFAFRFGFKRRIRSPDKQVSNEALYFFGVLFTSVSAGFIRETTLFEGVHIAWFLLALTLILAVLGFKLRSMLIWSFALLFFAGWGIEQTSVLSNDKGYFLGLNIPWRMLILGGIVLTGAKWLQGHPKYHPLYEPSRFIGLLYLLSSLWIISIVGNYGDAASWAKVAQTELLHWALLAIASCIGLLIYGVRNNDKLIGGFAMTFLLINLYTRYFEYFWDSMHKTLFFAGLALSFWLIGSKAETLWQLSTKSK